MGGGVSGAGAGNGTVRLALSQIVEDRAFDIRADKLNPDQVSAIIQGLRNGRTVEPAIVWQDPADGAYRVVDGWHRLAAFAQWKPGEAAPVRVLEAGKLAAAAEAMRRRSEGSVTLTTAERMNGAWRMVRTPPLGNAPYAYSKRDTALACGVSERLIAKMRTRLTQLRAVGREPEGDWSRDRRDHDEGRIEMTDRERDAFVKDVANAVNKALVGFRRKDDQAMIEGIAAGLGVQLTDHFLSFMRSEDDEAFDDPWRGGDPSDGMAAEDAAF